MKLASLRPGYLLRRIRQIYFEKSHPDCPWLTPAAVLFLDNWLKKSDHGFEWGSGRSTRWFAERVGRLVSVEDNAEWYGRVKEGLGAEGTLTKVDYRMVPCVLAEQDEPERHPYADIIDEFPDGHFDFVLVDGNIRLACMRRALAKLKPCGLLILDNANRYVPNRFGGGFCTVSEPRSEPRTPAWAGLMDRLGPWRWVCTTNGIWDTRFWVKPASA